MLLALLQEVECMFSKRPLPNRDGLSPSKRLRANMDALLLQGDVSAHRAFTMYDDATHVDSTGQFASRARAGRKGLHPGNLARDLLSKIRKGKKNGWPSLYYADLPFWSPKQQKMVISRCPMFLPHQLLQSLLEINDLETLLQTTRLTASASQHLGKVKASLGADVIPVTLWGDGVPCNWDRSESVEVLALSLPGVGGNSSAMRIPILGINKKFMMKDETWDAIFKVLAWSFKAAALGRCPKTRHDNSPWEQKSDRERIKQSGTPLGFRACLVEIKADWAFLAHGFRFPAHNLSAGFCWRCTCKPEEMGDFSLTAKWRTAEERTDHFKNLQRWADRDVLVSPIFEIPYLHTGLFIIDWLHCVDQGTCSDTLGNIFHYFLPRLDGANQRDKVKTLFLKMLEFYKRKNVDSQFQDLTLLMIVQPKKGPKLRARAAEARALVPFARELAEAYCDEEKPKDVAVRAVARKLEAVYDQLSGAVYVAERMSQAIREFLLLYKSLSDISKAEGKVRLWKIKPKHHLMAEIGMTADLPSLNWCYRDEDFGGTCAKLCRRRGGKNSVLSTGKAFLLKYSAMYRIPFLA